MTIGNTIMSGAITKAIIDSASPNFKLPPGVTSPMAPGVAHMAIGDGIPNAAKNHMSGVQRDAISAGVRSMRTLSGPGPLDGWGTRQTSEHRKFPTYAGYLKQMVDNFQIGPGYGVGAVPAGVMRSTAWINPAMPFGPGNLGEGIDFFGLQNAQRMSVNTKDGLNPVLPMNFDVTRFQLDQGNGQTGFSVPQSAARQLPHELVNMYPKGLSYAYGNTQ